MSSIFNIFRDSPNKQVYNAIETLSIDLLTHYNNPQFLNICLNILEQAKIEPQNKAVLKEKFASAYNHFDLTKKTEVRTLYLVNKIRFRMIQTLNLQSDFSNDPNFEKIGKQFKQACESRDEPLIRKLLIEHKINVNTFNFCKIVEQCIKNDQVEIIHLFLRVGLNLHFYLKYLGKATFFESGKLLKPAELETFIKAGAWPENDEDFLKAISHRDDLLLLLFSHCIIEFPKYPNVFVTSEKANSVREEALFLLQQQSLQEKIELCQSELEPLFPPDLRPIITGYLFVSMKEIYAIIRDSEISTYCLINFPYRIDNYSSGATKALIQLEELARNAKQEAESYPSAQFLQKLYEGYQQAQKARQEAQKARQLEQEREESERRARDISDLAQYAVPGI